MSSEVRSSGPVFVVLCIDEQSVLQSQLQVLGAAGFRVLIATSGARALNILGHTPVNAVVLDHKPGELDGLALAVEIKRVHPEMPVILFSASPDHAPSRLRQLASKIVAKGNSDEALVGALQGIDRARPQVHGIRAYPRYDIELRVLLSMTKRVTSGVFWVTTRTLGEGGLGADVPVSLKEDEIVLLDLMLWDNVLTLPASVRYHAGSLHGFKFIDITSEQRRVIRDYCQIMQS